MSSATPSVEVGQSLLDKHGGAILNKIMESKDVHVFVMDVDQVVVEWGRGLEEDLGWKRKDILGERFPAVLAETNEKWEQLYERALSGERQEAEIQLEDINEQNITMNLTLSPLDGENSEVIGVVGTFEDIQERKQAEEELRDFVYSASHDLKEPLRKMLGFTDLLKQDAEDFDVELPEEMKDSLNEITDASRRMQKLVDSLLRLSRAGRQSLDLQEAWMDQSIDEALENLREQIRDTNADINRDDMPKIKIDPPLLTQVWQNLIGNAIKYSGDETPKIHLTQEEKTGAHLFGVKDNGIGIEEEYREKIFEPFSRLYGRDEYTGSGIGLAIVEKIIDRHDGRIWVESELGEGSHFKFVIPKEAQMDNGQD